MDRRKFLAQSCGACAAVSLGLIFSSSLLESCASTGLSVFKTSAEGGKVKVSIADFAQNNFKLIRVAGYNYDIGVQKKEDGSFLAMVLMCTHARHPLTKAGNGYYCTLHGSKFSGDGKVEKGPASTPMVHLATEIAGDDLIIII